jgi:solute carrier family 25 carnitine/acylcarnitine transporter 20/29
VGGTAGALVAYPIDTIKTRLQAVDTRGAVGMPAATLRGTILQLFRAEGMAGFYRGVNVMMISQGLYIGAAIGGMQMGRQIYDDAVARRGAAAAAGEIQHHRQGEPLSRLCAGGIVSGACCGTVATPFERLRVLLQTQEKEGARGPVAMMRHVARNGGVAGVFTGLPITIAREIPGCIVWIGSWDTCFRFLSTERSWDRAPAVLASAVFAPICWSLCIFPMERIKVQQQAATFGSTAAQEGMLQTAARIFRSRGIVGFAVGVIPLTGRNIMIDVVQLPSVDLMRQQLGIV